MDGGEDRTGPEPERWHFWIDRGGTFTDVVARSPQGDIHTAKLLSENPDHYPDAAVEAIRQLTGLRDGKLPPADLRIGTTIATNALLERKGEPVLLAMTEGLGDALAIGTQERPDIFARRIVKSDPLPTRVLEVRERIGADGIVHVPLDRAAALAGLREVRAQGIRAVAIALMHGYRYPEHEQALEQLAREAGFEEVAVSHRVCPLAKIIGRADTTALDAYLSPVLEAYTRQLGARLGENCVPLFMQSNGGLTSSGTFRGKDAVLSGPAGGIVGMAETSRAAGYDRVIGFDMGGTSTDVSLYAGAYERDNENIIAGVRVRAPMMRIHTVAAGGGSVCSFDGVRFLVGPESAGAQPGPACYREGGPLTVTDCNLLLGKLQPDHFPASFGPDGDRPIDRSAAEGRMDEILAQVEAATGERLTREAAAAGFVRIAIASMANAIRAVSVARGHDASRFALSCFGGAGGQHACLVADALGIETVLVHPLSGVLSAYGMGLADRRAVREASVGVPLDNDAQAIRAKAQQLADNARSELVGQGLDPEGIRVDGQAFLRTQAGESSIAVTLDTPEAMQAEFTELFAAQFGYANRAPLVVDMLRMEAVAETRRFPLPNAVPHAGGGAETVVVPVTFGDQACDTPVIARTALASGQRLLGPALVIDPVATIAIEPGWSGEVLESGMLVLERSGDAKREAITTRLDPVRLEIFGGLFMSIAEEMGAALQHSASSVNIRERLDFSCALFDAGGSLVANAPHMPVHLGSMGDSVRAVIDRHGQGMQPGDAFALNAPFHGGTHLPDITVVAPVFVDGQATPAWFVAARGHHADVGGIAPGSMPSASTALDQEGVVLDAVPLVRDGELQDDAMRALLASGRWPARNIDQNMADLAAQLAACRRGAERLLALAGDYGVDVVSAYMEHLQSYSAGKVHELLAGLEDGAFACENDSGARIAVAVAIDRSSGTARIDFTGTSPQQPDNFNAPMPVARAACIYVIRCLIDTDIPMNDGFLRPVEISVPPGSMLAPDGQAAVVAGNVETSQLVTDALFGALGAMAASQGTMNNFTFGDGTRQYYETIAGGAGAGPGFAGADAVQTHMTNSRLTDPEVLEQRYPVLLERFAIRRGSGGRGQYAGGDGAVRRIRFLEPMEANILSGRRRVAPFGLAGGGEGACGRNRIERSDGTVEEVPATASVGLEPGDVFVIETPGGGGYGA